VTDIFPRRNLPPRAEQWGRAIEGEITSLERLQTQDLQGEGNWGRAAAGRLAVLSTSVEEVSNRLSTSIQLDTMSVTGSATFEPFPRLNQTVTFPATNGNRTARVVLTGNVTESTPTQSRLYIYLIHNGEVLSAAQVQPSAPASTPAEWQNDAPAFILGTLRTESGVPTQVTVRIVRGADEFTPGTSTMELVSPVITLTRSGVA